MFISANKGRFQTYSAVALRGTADQNTMLSYVHSFSRFLIN